MYRDFYLTIRPAAVHAAAVAIFMQPVAWSAGVSGYWFAAAGTGCTSGRSLSRHTQRP